MTDLVTDWQQALIELLEQEPPNGLGIRFLPMRRDGISTETDIGCVFPDDPAWEGANSGRSIFAQFNMVIRVWLRFDAEPSQNIQPDPTPVNALGARLAELLQPVQMGLLDDLYFFATRARYDYPSRGVELRLLGWSFNPAMLPMPV